MTIGSAPSPWVVQFVPRIDTAGWVLDLAAGGGRHTHYLREKGHPVLALDRDVNALRDRESGSRADPVLEIVEADLEDGSPWILGDRRFAGIVVTNYLHRPLLPLLVSSLAPGGLLIYETFAEGNERFGKPSNPAFLLAPGELLVVARQFDLTVLGYFCGEVSQPKPAMVQRLAARAVR